MLTGAALDGVKRARPEKEIQRAILHYLAARRILAWEEKTLGFSYRRKGETKLRHAKVGLKGRPDISGIIPVRLLSYITAHGVPLYIEVKRPGEKPDPHQVVRMRQLTDAGALVFVATSIEDVQRALDAAGIRS